MRVTRCTSLATLHARFRLETSVVWQQCACVEWKRKSDRNVTGWGDLLVSNTTSHGEKRFPGNQLCKYWIMQMLHLNKSTCLGRKDFGVVFYFGVRSEERKRERRGKRAKTRIRLENVTGRHSMCSQTWFGFLIREKDRNTGREERIRANSLTDFFLAYLYGNKYCMHIHHVCQ